MRASRARQPARSRKRAAKGGYMTRLLALSTPAPSQHPHHRNCERNRALAASMCLRDMGRAATPVNPFCCAARGKFRGPRPRLWRTAQVVSPTRVPYCGHIPPTFLHSGFAKRIVAYEVGSQPPLLTRQCPRRHPAAARILRGVRVKNPAGNARARRQGNNHFGPRQVARLMSNESRAGSD